MDDGARPLKAVSDLEWCDHVEYHGGTKMVCIMEPNHNNGHWMMSEDRRMNHGQHR